MSDMNIRNNYYPEKTEPLVPEGGRKRRQQKPNGPGSGSGRKILIVAAVIIAAAALGFGVYAYAGRTEKNRKASPGAAVDRSFTIVNCLSFYNDRAWITGQEDDQEFLGVIDTDGNLVFKQSDHLADYGHMNGYADATDTTVIGAELMNKLSGFNDTSAFITLSNGDVSIIDRSGKELARITGNPTVAAVGNYYIVSASQENGGSTSVQYGVMDKNGQWTRPLSSPTADTYETFFWKKSGGNLSGVQDIGGNIAVAGGGMGYNADKNEFFIFDVPPEIAGQSAGALDYIHFFNDQIVARAKGTQKDQFALYDSTGGLISSLNIPDASGSDRQGMVFDSTKGITYYWDKGSGTSFGCAFDMNGNILYSFSSLGVTSVEQVLYPSDGYAVFVVKTDGGLKYGVVDSSGKFTFAPKDYTDYGSSELELRYCVAADFEKKVIVIRKSRDENTYTILDLQGNEKATFTPDDGAGDYDITANRFGDGLLALVGSGMYVNTDGETVISSSP